jgi:hypothetical protein
VQLTLSDSKTLAPSQSIWCSALKRKPTASWDFVMASLLLPLNTTSNFQKRTSRHYITRKTIDFGRESCICKCIVYSLKNETFKFFTAMLRRVCQWMSSSWHPKGMLYQHFQGQAICEENSTCRYSGFGGLGVCVLASGTQDRGFAPDWSRRIFHNGKIHSTQPFSLSSNTTTIPD